MARFAVVAALLCAFSASAWAIREKHAPAELTDDSEVDILLQMDEEEDFHFPLHFNIPLDDEFHTTAFIAESESVVPVPPEDADNADSPIVCETICRPMNATDQMLSGAAAAYNKAAGNSEGEEEKAVKAKVESEEAPATLLVELDRKICSAQGGQFNDATGTCDSFMRATEGSTEYDGETIFSLCQTEMGTQYVPCSPYQALALAHLYEVPDHEHYWLWPGGRANQVTQAVFKQEIGHNPREGMDRCRQGEHVGFFHNWDEAHVDSWGCFPDSRPLRVLCCRRN